MAQKIGRISEYFGPELSSCLVGSQPQVDLGGATLWLAEAIFHFDQMPQCNSHHKEN